MYYHDVAAVLAHNRTYRLSKHNRHNGTHDATLMIILSFYLMHSSMYMLYAFTIYMVNYTKLGSLNNFFLRL